VTSDSPHPTYPREIAVYAALKFFATCGASLAIGAAASLSGASVRGRTGLSGLARDSCGRQGWVLENHAPAPVLIQFGTGTRPTTRSGLSLGATTTISPEAA
jgi:hypothetical protein